MKTDRKLENAVSHWHTDAEPPASLRARVLNAEERAELWPKVEKAYKGYAGYQRKTTREIPLIVLEA